MNGLWNGRGVTAIGATSKFGMGKTTRTVRGTSLIEQVGGARLKVNGTSAVAGRWMLAENGNIVTQLPDLPFARIEV